MFSIVSLAAALMVGGTGPGQSAAPPTFEVASIKPAAPCCAPGQWRESKAGDDRIDFRYVTLRYCIAFAYGLKEYQVSGPAWLGEVRYDIVAKAPEGTKHVELPQMMQALLAERFKLEVHRDKKEFSVFALVMGKNGPKLEPSKDSESTAGASFGMSTSATGVGRMEARHCDMPALANTLPRLVGRPVVDQTGLSGRYDFVLEFSREEAAGMVATDGFGSPASAGEVQVSVFTSLQQIGLRLDSKKLPLDVIVVDRAEKTATEN